MPLSTEGKGKGMDNSAGKTLTSFRDLKSSAAASATESVHPEVGKEGEGREGGREGCSTSHCPHTPFLKSWIHLY